MDQSLDIQERAEGPGRLRQVVGILACFLGAFLAGSLLTMGWVYVRSTPEQINGRYERFFAHVEEPIILYSSSACPACAKATNYLLELGVPFKEHETLGNPFTTEQLKSLGIDTVPVLMFRDELIVGYRASVFRNALRRHGLLRAPESASS